MAVVLVTGGTGTLGSALLPRLIARGHQVRSLSRHGSPAAPRRGVITAGRGVTGVSYVRGDVRRGAGLAEAVAGVDTVIHAATSPVLSRAVEVEGTDKVVAAANRAEAHVIYVSIVGVDMMKLSYYRAKSDAEALVEASGARWTIQRATQFHDLVDRFLRWRVFPVTKNFSFQPVDTGDLSGRLADLVDAGPGGRADDFGGPAVLSLRELAAIRRTVTGKSTLLVPVPAAGPLVDFEQGRNLCPDHAEGRIGWEEWLTKARR